MSSSFLSTNRSLPRRSWCGVRFISSAKSLNLGVFSPHISYQVGFQEGLQSTSDRILPLQERKGSKVLLCPASVLVLILATQKRFTSSSQRFTIIALRWLHEIFLFPSASQNLSLPTHFYHFRNVYFREFFEAASYWLFGLK